MKKSDKDLNLLISRKLYEFILRNAWQKNLTFRREATGNRKKERAASAAEPSVGYFAFSLRKK